MNTRNRRPRNLRDHTHWRHQPRRKTRANHSWVWSWITRNSGWRESGRAGHVAVGGLAIGRGRVHHPGPHRRHDRDARRLDSSLVHDAGVRVRVRDGGVVGRRRHAEGPEGGGEGRGRKGDGVRVFWGEGWGGGRKGLGIGVRVRVRVFGGFGFVWLGI